jgi:hypothetical protein
MSQYCTIDDLKNILPKNIIIGNMKERANCSEERALFFIEENAGIIDSQISALYRIPLIKYKEPDFSSNPVIFLEKYPRPITLINARLAAASLYDYIMNAQQEPNVSEWGKNQRALAYDDLKSVQAGLIQLKGQVKNATRFVRQELFDPARVPSKNGIQPPNRAAGQ